jgi:uncharacterized protein (DUF1015 family)
MSEIRPFKALRPKKELAAKVASPPYDVLNSSEARKINQRLIYLKIRIYTVKRFMKKGLKT